MLEFLIVNIFAMCCGRGLQHTVVTPLGTNCASSRRFRWAHLSYWAWEKKDATDTDRYASYLDLHLDIDSEGWVRTKLYYKRDYFNFPIVNFPFTCSNIPAAPAYGVYISQLIWYSRDCGSYQDFFNRGLLQTGKLLNQGFLLVKLKSSLRKFYDRHHDLVDHYRIYVSQMATDIFHLS
jgi:hypothetical protein